METIKLYDKDAYQTEFEAKVVADRIEGDKEFVELDQTLFFPEEGGQSADKGFINGRVVQDVQIKNGVITHILKKEKSTLAEGEKVQGSIDWEHRFYNMQNHTGEHILSGIIHSRFGYNNVGFHLGDELVTLDLDGPISQEQLLEVEREANEAVFKNVDVIARYPAKEELAKMDYRSKIEIDGAVRIVTIPGYDMCACCAPHVAKTGEVGIIKIIKSQSYKGGVRITISCGRKGVVETQTMQTQILSISQLLSAPMDEVDQAVKKLQEENLKMRAQMKSLWGKLIEVKADAIPEGQEKVVLFEEGMDAVTVREYVELLKGKTTGVCAVFSGNDEQGYQYVMGSTEKDCREIQKVLKEKLGAKGGGKPESVQGRLQATRQQIKEIIG